MFQNRTGYNNVLYLITREKLLRLQQNYDESKLKTRHYGKYCQANVA